MYPPATKCAHDLATGAGFKAMSTSFDWRSCSRSSVAVGGIMCVPDVFVKAGVPTGTMSEIAMVLTAVSSRDTG